jgi:beta-aspartyl-peptidase (threonine type)
MKKGELEAAWNLRGVGLALAFAVCFGGIGASAQTWSIAIHGGAGVIERSKLTPERDAAYRAALGKALDAGAAVLDKGGSSLDAVETVAKIMEDDPLFNAGRGAAIGADGRVTLDAAIMDGATLKAGSVAGLTTTRHPISVARAVMEKTRHVFLIGEGADQFAREQGLAQVPNSFFMTARRWGLLEEELKDQKLPIPPKPAGLTDDPPTDIRAQSSEARFGTIGIVARDKAGRIAAGTSTGGLTGKRWGRVGDAPIIGAGTYADATCGVSATGTGEYFIRLTVARRICEQAGKPRANLQRAVDRVIQKDLTALGGDGGVIAVNARGDLAWSMNTEGMYRAQQKQGGPARIAVYADER